MKKGDKKTKKLKINIIKFIKPNDPRTIKDIAKMPISLLNLTEKKNINTSDEYVSIEDKLKLQLR